MYRTVPLSIIRPFSLYVTHSNGICHRGLLCVQGITPDGEQRNCPKHVEFHSKNKFEKLVHLVGFIIRNLTRCTVTWTSHIVLNLIRFATIGGFQEDTEISKIRSKNVYFQVFIIIIYLSCSWATCWRVPVSRIQKSLQRSAMTPSASWGIAFYYPG